MERPEGRAFRPIINNFISGPRATKAFREFRFFGCFFYIDRSFCGSPNLCSGEPFGIPVYIDKTTQECRKEMPMILYLSARTTVKDLMIDYIEVELVNGETVSLNWDESDIGRTGDGFSARYKGVYFGEVYANGRLEQLQDMKITDIGLYSESDTPLNICITSMEFEDDGRRLAFETPNLDGNIVCQNESGEVIAC